MVLLLLFWMSGSAGCPANEPPAGANSNLKAATTLGEEEVATSLSRGSRHRPVHDSPIAGSWYPGNSHTLRPMLAGFLAQAPETPSDVCANIIALVAPHAGYVYSGRCAAFAFKILQQRKPRRVILLGPSHHARFHGISLGDYRAYSTPLGELLVDPEAHRLLSPCPLVQFHPTAHEREHCLDIMLPFLQEIFPEDPPAIVPLVVGHLEEDDYPVLARCLRTLLNSTTVILASSDFTHYGPRFGYLPFPHDNMVSDNLEKLDQGAYNSMVASGRSGFLDYVDKTGITVCGYRALALLLELLPGQTKVRQLCYDTSGRVTGDYQNSVSYLSAAFYNADLWNETGKQGTGIEESTIMKKKGFSPARIQNSGILTDQDKTTLLRLSRNTLEEYVRKRNSPDAKDHAYSITENLKQKRGAFVTLTKNGKLRGCIGYIKPIESLYEAVKQNTINAATRDSRFPAVRPEELSSIELEISVLSVPEPIAAVGDIVLGQHGIILKKGNHQAVFLPQVALEQGWDRPETLRHLSRKAGLSSDAWESPDTEFLVFTAEVLEETQHGSKED